MAANGLRGSPSIPKTLPPKKRNSRENLNEAPVEPVFKTPSPFWNQNQNFRRSRRPREPASASYIDLHSAAAYHPLWIDGGCASNQVLLHPLGDNGTFSSWGPYFESSEQFLGVSNHNRNNPTSVNDFYGASSYWSYAPLTEQRDLLFKSYGRFSNQYKPKIIKPVPRSLASHYTRSVHKDAPSGQFDMGSARDAQWDERLRNESVKNDMRMRKRSYIQAGIKQNSGRFAETGTDLSRHKYYSVFKDLSQERVSKTEDLETQRFPVIHQSCSKNEQLKSGTEVTMRDEHPLLARSEKAEAQEQQENALSSSQLWSRFFEGSLIELDGGRLKRVEDLQLEDFKCCTASCPELSLTRFTVKKITSSDKPGLICLEVEVDDNLRSKISLEVCEEYPFFVCSRGWSSCHPDRTANLCCLRCQQLHLGDMCLALTPVPVSPAQVTRPGTGGGDVGLPNCAEGANPSKLRRRHSSAPELRIIQ